MPRDGSGNYSLPSGTAVTGGTTILASVWNNFTSDVASVLDAAQPITKGGTGAATVGAAQTALDIPARTGTVTVTGNWTYTGTNNFTGAAVTVATPSADAHPVTKAYADSTYAPKGAKITLNGTTSPALTAQTGGTWITAVAVGGAGGGRLRLTIDDGVVDGANLIVNATIQESGTPVAVPGISSLSSTLLEITLVDDAFVKVNVNDSSVAGHVIHIIAFAHA